MPKKGKTGGSAVYGPECVIHRFDEHLCESSMGHPRFVGAAAVRVGQVSSYAFIFVIGNWKFGVVFQKCSCSVFSSD